MNTVSTSVPVAPPDVSPALRRLSWIARGIAAAILLQTLFFKFTGAAESINIFETVGLEPWGRYGSGVAELVAAVLLLVPATPALGATLSLGVISGAIFFHFTKLGLVVENDGGLLFILAVVAFVCSAFVLVTHRRELPVIGNRF